MVIFKDGSYTIHFDYDKKSIIAEDHTGSTKEFVFASKFGPDTDTSYQPAIPVGHDFEKFPNYTLEEFADLLNLSITTNIPPQFLLCTRYSNIPIGRVQAYYNYLEKYYAEPCWTKLQEVHIKFKQYFKKGGNVKYEF